MANDVASLVVVYPVKDGLPSVFGEEDEEFETGNTISCLLCFQILVVCAISP